MLRRLAVVLASAAVAVPLLSGTASASCTDDLLARDLEEGSQPQQYPSEHWYDLHYVHVTGTATVLVEGDALVSDVAIVGAYFTGYSTVVAGNAADAGADWVDCVAG